MSFCGLLWLILVVLGECLTSTDRNMCGRSSRYENVIDEQNQVNKCCFKHGSNFKCQNGQCQADRATNISCAYSEMQIQKLPNYETIKLSRHRNPSNLPFTKEPGKFCVFPFLHAGKCHNDCYKDTDDLTYCSSHLLLTNNTKLECGFTRGSERKQFKKYGNRKNALYFMKSKLGSQLSTNHFINNISQTDEPINIRLFGSNSYQIYVSGLCTGKNGYIVRDASDRLLLTRYMTSYDKAKQTIVDNNGVLRVQWELDPNSKKIVFRTNNFNNLQTVEESCRITHCLKYKTSTETSIKGSTKSSFIEVKFGKSQKALMTIIIIFIVILIVTVIVMTTFIARYLKTME